MRGRKISEVYDFLSLEPIEIMTIVAKELKEAFGKDEVVCAHLIQLPFTQCVSRQAGCR